MPKNTIEREHWRARRLRRRIDARLEQKTLDTNGEESRTWARDTTQLRAAQVCRYLVPMVPGCKLRRLLFAKTS